MPYAEPRNISPKPFDGPTASAKGTVRWNICIYCDGRAELHFGCREAKERLLSDEECHAYSVVIPSRGSFLFGSALDGEITRQDVEAVVLDCIFPRTRPDEYPAERIASDPYEKGLSYANDPAISRHLAQFLGRQRAVTERLAEIPDVESRSFLHPSAILFYGGVLTPKVLRRRIVEVLNGWIIDDGGRAVRVLKSASLDLAVARGAAYYARVHHGSGRGVRIRGGTARAYYLGVESRLPAGPAAVPALRAFCVAPFGMEEGTAVEMTDQPFGLVVGEPVEFRFLAFSIRRNDRVGDAVDDLSKLEELPSISTTLEGASGKIVPIHIKARITEVGILQLWCVERQGDKLWKVEYSVRIADADLDS